MNRYKRVILAMVALAAMSAAIAARPQSAVTVQAVPDLPAGFIMGADVSTLDQVEHAGGKFYNEDGLAQDALAILKHDGVNWIRLRLWHTPVNPADVVVNGKTLSHKGDPVGGGNNDLATTVRLAQRAKALGLKVLLDIHYSDFWADPEKQTKPAAWQDLHGAALQQAVYQYTAKVMQTLEDAHATPDMVQVGNELNGGMLWPDGKTWREAKDAFIGGDDGFVALMKQGIAAIRANDQQHGNRHTPIAVHLANGTSNELYRRVFDLFTRNQVDYDIIGLSYYPYLHGGIEDLRTNMDDIAFRYRKPVAVLEVSYAWTLDNGDNFANIFGPESQKVIGYKATVQGQASLIRDVIDAVNKVPAQRGLGLFYWEPAWLPVAGAGWRTGEGNGWDNQTLFDFSGHALPSLAVFRRVREPARADDAPKLLAPNPLPLTAWAGENWVPPSTLRLPFSDDAERPVYIDWADVPTAKLAQVGQFKLTGDVSGQPPIIALVNVVPRRNQFVDPGFESGTLDGWVITGDKGVVSNERNPGNAHSGQQSLHYWLGQPFSATVSHTFSKLQPGNYVFKAWSAGGGGEKALTLFAKDCGGPTRSAAMSNNGWQQWHQFAVTGIKVTGDQCTVGIQIDGQTGNWGNVDDLDFSREDAS
ncbi:glycosyl hydrolase 53 family protein [Silvimonas sp.]|uniref:glycosyl hydrolase 53 family protein n=1 Tax=Silvimonas sp. TaxID=2650811 RepID=UPI0028420E65|nr:glycosyl hydrolase 53 family protein [Silvimonas sp.]MDR3427228.1 glycosyl hydrolase 53 family protein [Silvimonas sp.]